MSEKSRSWFYHRPLVISFAAAVLLSACGETHHSSAPKLNEQALVQSTAQRIDSELYQRKAFPKGVLVPGVINGNVVITLTTVTGNHQGVYHHPILLEPTGDSEGSLDGAYIGVPGNDANGHVVITPIQLRLGGKGYNAMSLQLEDNGQPILKGVGVYPTSVTDEPDQLIGFDIAGGGNFPSFPINSTGMK